MKTFIASHNYMMIGGGEHKASALAATDHKDAPILVYEKESEQMENERKYVVRRLTPKECARLQGFPDDWCDGVAGTDANQYKLWGNGMALPCLLYVLQGVRDVLRKEKDNERSL